MKKVLSLLLSTMLLVTLALPAFSAGPVKGQTIAEIVNYKSHEAYYEYQEYPATHPENTTSESYILIPLRQLGFLDENGAIITWSTVVNPNTMEQDLGPSVSQLKSNNVKPVILDAKLYNYIKSIEFVKYDYTDRVRAQSAIKITFIEDFITTKDLYYEFEIYLSLHNSRTDSFETFGGRMYNEVYDVTNKDYVFIGDGAIAYAETGNAMGIDMDLGNGVHVLRDLYKGEKYYGITRIEPNEKQDPITAAYKQITHVIKIDSIEVKWSGMKVQLDKELHRPDYYVYDAFGVFVGMSHDTTLPYSSTYYLSYEEIDIDPSLSEELKPTVDEELWGAALSSFIEGGKENGTVPEE